MPKVVIVTGSTKGIGEGIARAFVAKGASVVITSRNGGDAETLAHDLDKHEGRVIGLRFDLEDRSTFAPLIEQTLAKFGRIDVLVNNALSQSCVPPMDVLSDQQVEFAFTANITNTLLLTRKCLEQLRVFKGNVVNISSVAANRHVQGMPLYGIIKAAINQMTQVLAAEWAEYGVRVNSVNPGFVYSSALTYFGVPDDVIAAHYKFCERYHPLGRIGAPDDIGKLVTFLASDEAGFMTGSVINCDGGYSVQGIQMPK